MPNPTYIAPNPTGLGVTSFDPPGTVTHIAENPAGSVYPASAAVSPTDPEIVTVNGRLDTIEASFTKDGIILENAAGTGIKVDVDTPVYPWRDLEGLIYPDPANPSAAPTVAAFLTGLFAYAYSDGDQCHFSFHIPHDYVPGTDLFLHVHWAHNATGVAANTLTWAFKMSYAKGFAQDLFDAPISPSITYPMVNLTTTPQYQHKVTEIQLSAASPTAAQFDSDDIEVDGLIIGTMTMGIPAASFTGGTPDEAIYIFTIDLHYQSTGVGTKGKAPSFYA